MHDIPTPSAPRAMRGHVSQATRLISERLLRFGLDAVLRTVVLVGAVAAAPANAQSVRLPFTCQHLSSAERATLDAQFGGGIDVCKQIAAGTLVPGETYDLALPPNRFNRVLYLWIDQLNADERIGSVSTDEIIRWADVEEEFERLRKWAERRRKGQL